MKRNKIKTQKEIFSIIHHLKRQGKKIITINGSFDILHIGHIKSLQEASAQGNVLIVLLNSDKSVRLYKGPDRPINSQKQRSQVLAALECVDYVTIFDELTPKEILAKIKPNIHCNTPDWGLNCIERETVERNGGKIYILKWQKGFSTTKLINKSTDLGSQPLVKAVFFDRDGTININQPEYIHRKEDFKFAPYVIPALRKLSKTDYKIIILTNQSGIGRGYYKRGDMEKLHAWLLKEFQKKEIRIDKIYYCPHHPNAHCSCRKPKIGLLMKAVRDFGISLNKSWIIGDDGKDILMGREANIKTIKIGKKMPKKLKIQPNYYAESLREAVNIIIKRASEKRMNSLF